MTATMKAATQTRYGAPDVLRVTDVTAPRPGPKDVLIAVHASVITQGDRRLRSADFPGFTAVFGRLLMGLWGPRQPVPGTMFSGRVLAVGAEVTRWATGDEVFGSADGGAHAEQLVLPEDAPLAKKPANLSHAEAAAVPYGAGTALTFLRDMAKVKAGERVLIHGASGGVGRFAVQVGAHLGAEVTAVCSRSQDMVRELGATHVIDYRTDDFTRNGQRYDVILDCVEGDRFSGVRGSLTEQGRYLSLYITLGLLLRMALGRLGRGPRALTGVSLGDAKHVEELRQLAEAGAIRPVLAARYPLGRIQEAHAFLERDKPRGSVVIEVIHAAKLRAA